MLNSEEKRCYKCGGPLKESFLTKEIQTTFSKQRRIILEELPILECKICTNKILTKDSEIIMDAARKYVRRKFGYDDDGEFFIKKTIGFNRYSKFKRTMRKKFNSKNDKWRLLI